MKINMDANEYEGLSKSNASKFRSYYENEYKTLYPAPKKQIVGLDWKFYTSVATGLATVILASLRTAQMFYFAAETSAQSWGLSQGGTELLSYGDALASMFAVEFGLVVTSAVKSVNEKIVPPWIYSVQIILLLVISVIAGVGQSLGLVQGISPDFLRIFSYILVFVLGVGASFAAWFSGEILGVQIQKYSELKAEAEKHFSEQMRIYSQNARKFWGQKSEQEKETSREQKKIVQNSPLPTSQRSSPRVQNRTGGGKVPLIFSEIEKFVGEQNRVPSFSELAEILRRDYPEQNFSSSGYISTVRKNWIESREMQIEQKSENEK